MSRNNKYPCRVVAMLSSETKRELEKIAQREGLSESALVRNMIRKQLQSEKESQIVFDRMAESIAGMTQPEY